MNDGSPSVGTGDDMQQARAPWRSIHYVPTNVPRYVEKALALDADAFQVDLEDSIADQDKQAARSVLPTVVQRLAATGADVLVRVNRPLGLAVRDIEAAVCPQVSAISLSKVYSADHVRLMAELITQCELAAGMSVGHTGLLVIIETAAAWQQMATIARASPRVLALMLGSEDFALDLGAVPVDDVLLLPKQQMVIAARAAGVSALGFIGSVADFRDEVAFRAMVARSRRFGFTGGTSVHPSQIALLNDEYGIPPAEIEAASRILSAAEEAATQGRGAFRVDGRMVDAPVIERARQTLIAARHAAQRDRWRTQGRPIADQRQT